MDYLLLHQDHQADLLSALEVCYERWQRRDRLQAEVDRKAGLIRCYSQMHLIFEMPIAAVKTAERVSFTNGVLGPPDGEYYFLLGDNFRKDLTRLLAREGFGELGVALVSARTVRLPEVHGFVDANGDEYEIVGWDKEDARRRIEDDGRARGPLHWSNCWPAFPFKGAIYRGRSPSYDDPEPSHQTEAEAAFSTTGGAVAAAAAALTDGTDEVPF